MYRRIVGQGCADRPELRHRGPDRRQHVRLGRRRLDDRRRQGRAEQKIEIAQDGELGFLIFRHVAQDRHGGARPRVSASSRLPSAAAASGDRVSVSTVKGVVSLGPPSARAGSAIDSVWGSFRLQRIEIEAQLGRQSESRASATIRSDAERPATVAQQQPIHRGGPTESNRPRARRPAAAG